MDKEEMLKKSKHAGVDERLEKIEADSSNWGLVTVIATVIFFGIWNWIRGIKSFELTVILAGYITTICLY